MLCYGICEINGLVINWYEKAAHYAPTFGGSGIG